MSVDGYIAGPKGEFDWIVPGGATPYRSLCAIRLGETNLGGRMARPAKPGAVIFTGNKERLARFYEAVTDLPVRTRDDKVTVLASDTFELVIHALPGEPVPVAPLARQDAYVKPFFPVRSLAEARRQAAAQGGLFAPVDEEWSARGFRACEAVDPDGNAIQFREVGP